ncbi:hypothetical protein GCM10008024_28650 [Allgaiera indica]|jgi:hypothetical protein|uniref:Uncharacterized protein n=1 Tax=Allgaiera indica TaxID=765699 RepID=A0AAN5A176_9RHOB|nr:hypothetical protein GCM10008024_28650 [Allgaiera indica]SDX36876.1 hypothetical protein SAMN05444006_114115 [Allgaiera indica]
MGRPVQVAAIGFARSGVCFDHVDGQYRDIEDVDIWEPAFATWLRAAEAGLDFHAAAHHPGRSSPFAGTIALI